MSKGMSFDVERYVVWLPTQARVLVTWWLGLVPTHTSPEGFLTVLGQL